MSVYIIPFDQAPQALRDEAHEFCKRELTLPEGEKEWNLDLFLKAWIEIEDGEVRGVSAILRRIDIAVYRCTTARGNAKMNQRLHNYLADQGLMGQDVFIQFAKDDKMCEGWQEELEKAQAKPANRFIVKVRPI
jgi:hypothetical protein